MVGYFSGASLIIVRDDRPKKKKDAVGLTLTSEEPEPGGCRQDQRREEATVQR
jgi:hypothetical protein